MHTARPGLLVSSGTKRAMNSSISVSLNGVMLRISSRRPALRLAMIIDPCANPTHGSAAVPSPIGARSSSAASEQALELLAELAGGLGHGLDGGHSPFLDVVRGLFGLLGAL